MIPPFLTAVDRRTGTTTTFWPHYYSTPCLHDLHDRCKGVCKFCPEKCRCSCHAEKT